LHGNIESAEQLTAEYRIMSLHHRTLRQSALLRGMNLALDVAELDKAPAAVVIPWTLAPPQNEIMLPPMEEQPEIQVQVAFQR
jgi:hypothetical protein